MLTKREKNKLIFGRKIPFNQLVNQTKSLTKEERDKLYKAMRDYEKEIKPRFSCKRGDVIKFW